MCRSRRRTAAHLCRWSTPAPCRTSSSQGSPSSSRATLVPTASSMRGRFSPNARRASPPSRTRNDQRITPPKLLASSRPRRPGACSAEACVDSCARSVTHLRDALPRVLVVSLAPAADAAKYAADLGAETLVPPVLVFARLTIQEASRRRLLLALLVLTLLVVGFSAWGF